MGAVIGVIVNAPGSLNEERHPLAAVGRGLRLPAGGGVPTVLISKLGGLANGGGAAYYGAIRRRLRITGLSRAGFNP